MSILRRSRFAPIAAALACAALPASAAGEVGEVGAASIGDPYFPDAGNGGYDVSSYDLELDYTPKKNLLVGEALITATAKVSLDRFNLDLRDPLEVKSVRVGDAEATFEHAGHELSVTPSSQIVAGSSFAVSVNYRGKPKPVRDADGTTEGWIATSDGAFAPNEPQGSPSWYPCNDHPSDKAVFSIAITVPKKLQAVSNGSLASKTVTSGKRTWSWQQQEPMATYLATVAIGKFDLTRSDEGPVPSTFAIDPAAIRNERNPEKALKPLLRTPKLTRYLQAKLVPYPFATNGGILDDVPNFPYALETQTRPIYTSPPDDYLVIHEIVHQWFGDSVTPARWKDIWLNEGFATYAEWLYSEDHDSQSAAEIFDEYYETPAREEVVWNPPPGNPGSAKQLFATSVYARGAMTLQALRERVGDEVFFRILRAWLSENAYGNVTTDDFIALAERESGEELSEFFDIWLFRKGKPEGW
ncbi:MAG: M1 family metallopeptidase [Solirubrobacterales bacterium]